MFDFKSADGFISISRLLNEHNKSFGKKSVRIPTIMDVQNMDYSTEVNNDKINIIYTGNTGRSKEFLKPVFSTFSKYKYLAERIEFNIYGPDRSAVIANIGDKDLVDENNECIHIHGKVPQNSIPIVMQNADFLLFIRPNRRSSNAGFPTKFGESMTAGTPVITNNTGDINLYLKNSQNGFLLKDSTEGAVKEVFDQIIKLSDEERMILRINARKTAEESFDYRIYEKEINYLLE